VFASFFFFFFYQSYSIRSLLKELMVACALEKLV
jgi:hypothetical protein